MNHPVAATLDQERGERRHQADRLRPAPHRAGAPRAPLPAVQARHRRRAAQRDDARHRRGGPGRRGVHRQPHDRLRGAARERRRATARRRWRRSAASTPRRSARSRASTRPRKASMILWGMGISQHVHGTDNARCLIALSLMTGQIGRPGTGPASAARPEQRAGRVRRGPDPDDVSPTTSASTSAEARARFESAWGLADGTLDEKPGPHRGRDHERDQGRHGARHVHHGREPGDVGPRREPRARGARRARAPRGAGHLPHRDRLPRRRRSCRRRAFPEKTGTFTNTDRWCSWAARRSTCRAMRARTCGSSSRSRSRMGLPWSDDPVAEVFDEMRQHDAEHRRHHLGAARARARRHLSVPQGRRSGRVGRLHRQLPARERPRASSSRPTSSPPTSGPTPSTRWCSSPAASSSTGTPAA